jgi:hypothetical protein
MGEFYFHKLDSVWQGRRQVGISLLSTNKESSQDDMKLQLQARQMETPTAEAEASDDKLVYLLFPLTKKSDQDDTMKLHPQHPHIIKGSTNDSTSTEAKDNVGAPSTTTSPSAVKRNNNNVLALAETMANISMFIALSEKMLKRSRMTLVRSEFLPS